MNGTQSIIVLFIIAASLLAGACREPGEAHVLADAVKWLEGERQSISHSDHIEDEEVKYCVKRIDESLNFLRSRKSQGEPYVVYAMLRDTKLAGLLLQLEWVETNPDTAGLVLARASAGDAAELRLPVFASQSSSNSLRIARRNPDQRKVALWAMILPVVVGGCDWARLDAAPEKLRHLSPIVLCLPEDVVSEELEVGLYDSAGNESNRVRLFWTDSALKWRSDSVK